MDKKFRIYYYGVIPVVLSLISYSLAFLQWIFWDGHETLTNTATLLLGISCGVLAFDIACTAYIFQMEKILTQGRKRWPRDEEFLAYANWHLNTWIKKSILLLKLATLLALASFFLTGYVGLS